MKSWTKRRVSAYGTPEIEIAISVFGHDELLPYELCKIADGLTDDAMTSIKNRVGEPISRIKVQRNVK